MKRNNGKPVPEEDDEFGVTSEDVSYIASRSKIPGRPQDFEKGLPANPDAERFILGAILLDAGQEGRIDEVCPKLKAEHFSIEKHRKIYTRMLELHEDGVKVDRVTLANQLIRYGELESVDGLSYLVSLDDGLPNIGNLDSYINIILDKWALREIAISAQNLLNRALTAEEKPNELVASIEERLGDLVVGQSMYSNDFQNTLEVIQGYEGGLNAFLDPSKRAKGISTGFAKLDEMTGGLHAGDLIILAARPSMGKTAFAMNVAWHVAHSLKLPVAAFTIEMSSDSLLTRMLCAAARVDSQRFRAGYLNADERQKLRKAANEAVEAPLYLDQTGDISVSQMRVKLRRLAKRLAKDGQKLGLVVIDYLQLMGSKGKSENRTQEVSKISRGLKLLAKEMECPFLVLSQLSRAPETRQGDHRPTLADLRESGSIEQDADLVGFLFREEVYKRDREDLRGLAELILAKQRNGPIGKVDLVFLHSLTKFESMATDLDVVSE